MNMDPNQSALFLYMRIFADNDVLLFFRFEILWLTLCQLHNEFVIEVSVKLSPYFTYYCGFRS